MLITKETGKTILKAIGSVAIICFLLTRIDWNPDKFQDIIKTINFGWYALSLTGVILVLGLKSIRWNLLLKSECCDYPYLSSFIAYMSSFTIGLLTPGRVGEIARLYYVRSEKNIDFFHSFKTIVTDRLFDFAILIWFGLSGMLFFYKVTGDLHPLTYLLMTGVTMLIIWLVIRIVLMMIKSGKERMWFTFIYESWAEMFDRKMILPWILTCLSYFLFYSANWFILISIGEHVSLTEVGFILSLMSLVTLIPVTIAGFGTREASLIYLFGFYYLSPETAIIFSVLQFLAFFLWGGIIGWICWLIKPVKLSLIKADAAKALGYIRQINIRSKQ
jgi:glycosyltransferase 2 family protein